MDHHKLENPSLKVWIKGDFILHCILPLAPPPRLVTFNLKRMIAYSKTKGSSHYPNLTYNVWQHIACVKLSMKPELADIYFRLMIDYLLQDENVYKNAIDCNTDFRKTNPTVPAIPFVLLLYMQQVNRKILRNSMKGPEKYPSESVSESLKSSIGQKENIEQCALDFVKEHLRSMLELVALSEQPLKDHHTPEVIRKSFDFESFLHLDYLFEGSVEKQKDVLPFSKLMRSAFTKRNGSQEIDFYAVENLIRSKLQVDVFVVASPTDLSDLHSEPKQDGDDQSITSPTSLTNYRPKIVHNSKDAPNSHKVVMFSGIVRSTVVKGTEAMDHSVTHVYKCQNSHLYLMSPLKLLTIRRCRGSTVFSSPVRDIIRVQYCKDVTVVAVCRRLIIAGCQQCTFYVKTLNNPLILGGYNEQLTFAPFHTSYPQLESHMTEFSLPATPDFWNKPLCLLNGDAGAKSENDSTLKSTWSLLDPDSFYPFYLPLKFPSTAQVKVPGGLPANYKLSLERKEKCLKDWQELVADVDDKSKAKLKFIMQEQFSVWLKKEGKEGELDQLKRLQNAQVKKIKKK